MLTKQVKDLYCKNFESESLKEEIKKIQENGKISHVPGRSKNLLTVLFFMLNTMGQDCKDEKLSQQTASQGIRKILP